MFLNRSTLLLALTALQAQVAQVSAECVNDDDFKYFFDGKDRTCRNIRINEARRQILCPVEEVNVACPQTCGQCCENIDGFEFPRYNGKIADCEWLAEKTVRIEKYCPDLTIVVDGRTIRDGCPVVCDFCQDPIAVATVSPAPTVTASDAPSLEPSGAPTGAPSDAPSGMPSASPTEEPTRPPSPMPSPFPTLRPTSSPSETPSDLPSVSPSDAPSDMPSGSPSDSPSMQPSSTPSDMPSAQPSATPSSSPSASPSDAPSSQPSSTPSSSPSAQPSDVPSKSPSDVPSDLPSFSPSMEPSNNPTMSIKPSPLPSAAPAVPEVTDEPTEAPVAAECANTADFEFQLVNEGNMVTCTWLVQNAKRINRRRKNYCSGDVLTECPLGCGTCVGDDPEFMFKLEKLNKKQDCAWITKNANKVDERLSYCEKANIAAACALTCS